MPITTFLVIALLDILCAFFNLDLDLAVSAQFSSPISYNYEKESCSHIFQPPLQRLETTQLRSRIECAQSCAQHQLCTHFRHFPGSSENSKSSIGCEILGKLSTSSSPSAPTENPMTVTAAPMSFVNSTCYKSQSYSDALEGIGSTDTGEKSIEDLSGCWDPHCYEDDDPDLNNDRDWRVIIDLENPATLTSDHLQTVSHHIETNMVFFIAGTGETLSMPSTYVRFFTDLFSGTMVHSMEKFNHRFVNDFPSRVAYMIFSDGYFTECFFYQDGYSQKFDTSLSKMKIFAPSQEDFTEEEKAGWSSASIIINSLQKGYSIGYYNYAIQRDNPPRIAIYDINNRVSTNYRRVETPIRYHQIMQQFPHYRLSSGNLIGEWEQFSSLKNRSADDLLINTKWKPAINTSLDLDIAQEFVVLRRLVTQGHKFRVAFDSGFFDVDSVLQSNDDIYFLLPQQVQNPSSKLLDLSGETYGVRAFVSLKGHYSSCSHLLESEHVLDTNEEITESVRPFVDLKSWTAVYSVYSNGTVAFGTDSKVAECMTKGMSFSLLIQWVKIDKRQLFTACMLTMTDFGTRSVMVSAESTLTWHLSSNENSGNVGGELRVNERCDLEKILARTDGGVQRLVYNVRSIQPVVNLTDVRTTWFAL